MRGQITNGTERAAESLNLTVERALTVDDRGAELGRDGGCVQEITRYMQGVVAEFNGTHFRRPGGKLEVRCDAAESDCTREVILTIVLCFLGVGIVIWLVVKIRRSTLWRLGSVRNEYITRQSSRAEPVRIAICRAERLAVEGPACERQGEKAKGFSVGGKARVRYNQYGLRKTDYVRDVTTQTEKVGQGWETEQVCPGWGQHVGEAILQSLEKKVREREGASMASRIDPEFAGARTRADESRPPVKDVGPQIMTSDESGGEDLDTTIVETRMEKDAGADLERHERRTGERRPKKNRRSELDLLGASNIVRGLGLRSGRGREVGEKLEESEDGGNTDHGIKEDSEKEGSDEKDGGEETEEEEY